MLVERRRSAFPVEFIARVGIAWILISALLLGLHWSAILAGRFPDPDDALRLVQVRDLLAGQGWFDLTQYRIDAPGGGVAMHWSRIVDIPLALVILALTGLIGQAGAESAALVIVPLLTLGLVMLLAARIAWRLMGDEEATLTSLVLAISVPVLFQLSPMRIDHHGWQIVCALAAVNGLMARSPATGGRVIGAALAIWLAISIEGLPLTAALFAVLAWRWIGHRGERAWLVNAIQTFALLGIVLFAATRGFGDLVTYCDAIGPVHLAIFVIGAGAITLLARAEPVPQGVVFAGFALTGAAGIAVMLIAAPQCASGGFAELDPLVARDWHANVLEGRPIWAQSLADALQYAVTPLIGFIAAIRIALRSQDWLARFWFDYALLLLAALLVALFVARAGAVACVLAAPPLAWQLNRWLRRIRQMDAPAPRIAATALVVCALLPAMPVMLLTSAIPARAADDGAALPTSSHCAISDHARQLRAFPPSEVFAPLDLAPGLLLETGHSVLASGHHRGDKAMRLLLETATGSPEAARRMLTRRGTALVVACPGMNEMRGYARRAPNGFAAALASGNPPDWLEPIDLSRGSPLKAWHVRPEGNRAPAR